MSDEKQQRRKPCRDWGPWVYRGGGFLSLVGLWLLHTFTVEGLLSSVFLAPSDAGLIWPWGTRLVWWLLFYLLGSAAVQRLMWREGVLSFTSHRQLWAASHVSAVQRLARRARWQIEGIGAAVAQFRAHGVAMPWWRRIVGYPLRTVPAVSQPIPDTVQDTPVPAAA